jgi:hypothetical protein
MDRAGPAIPAEPRFLRQGGRLDQDTLIAGDLIAAGLLSSADYEDSISRFGS